MNFSKVALSNLKSLFNSNDFFQNWRLYNFSFFHLRCLQRKLQLKSRSLPVYHVLQHSRLDSSNFTIIENI